MLVEHPFSFAIAEIRFVNEYIVIPGKAAHNTELIFNFCNFLINNQCL